MDKTMDRTIALNLSEALDRVDGDQDLFLTLARMFLEESSKEAVAVRAALERQDGAGLAVVAHKLKGAVMEMCAPRLLVSVQRLEELGRQDNLAEALSVWADVETRLAEVEAALKELIVGGFPS